MRAIEILGQNKLLNYQTFLTFAKVKHLSDSNKDSVPSRKHFTLYDVNVREKYMRLHSSAHPTFTFLFDRLRPAIYCTLGRLKAGFSMDKSKNFHAHPRV